MGSSVAWAKARPSRTSLASAAVRSLAVVRSEALASSSAGADGEARSREALIHDLNTVKERLAQIHVTLESQLFSVKDLGPIFWQVVRFVGLGIVIGALLRGLVR